MGFAKSISDRALCYAAPRDVFVEKIKDCGGAHERSSIPVFARGRGSKSSALLTAIDANFHGAGDDVSMRVRVLADKKIADTPVSRAT